MRLAPLQPGRAQGTVHQLQTATKLFAAIRPWQLPKRSHLLEPLDQQRAAVLAGGRRLGFLPQHELAKPQLSACLNPLLRLVPADAVLPDCLLRRQRFEAGAGQGQGQLDPAVPSTQIESCHGKGRLSPQRILGSQDRPAPLPQLIAPWLTLPLHRQPFRECAEQQVGGDAIPGVKTV